jgi:hypothetical protein
MRNPLKPAVQAGFRRTASRRAGPLPTLALAHWWPAAKRSPSSKSTRHAFAMTTAMAATAQRRNDLNGRSPDATSDGSEGSTGDRGPSRLAMLRVTAAPRRPRAAPVR